MNTSRIRTILLADDDSAVIAALSVRLTSEGHRCIAARTGAEALACFDRETPDLVICDLHMPDGDGATLAECIRASSAVPIILISGVREEFRRRLRRIPDVTFVRKPFLTSDLLEIVDAAFIASDAATGSPEQAA
ncbi:MAG: response regulator [Phycisphaerales bacterium]|nr:response regulator [Planctomycetota bacterium]